MAKKKKSDIRVIAIFIILLLSGMGYAIFTIVNMEDYVPVNILEVSGSTVLIGNNCTAIIAETSTERAYSIDLGKRGIIEERPTTHDVFAESLKSFNITVDSVLVESYDDKYYYAYIVLKSGDKILKLDAKPSDAIALGLRTGSDIYIKKSLLAQIGKNVC